MNSRVTSSFTATFRKLPLEVRRQAQRAYKDWLANPQARNFKRVGDDVSVRIDRNYRALGFIEGDTVFWYWIGRHDEYDRKLN